MQVRRVQLESDAYMPTLVYLSLGSNVGDRDLHLRNAIAKLGAHGRIVSVSSFYETEPVEMVEQEWFLNAAVALETERLPEQLMEELLCTEQEMGRQRTQKKGPRTIDIDMLLFGESVLQSPQITIPHPAMHERRFVLEPLAEIAPGAQHPVFKKTVRQLLNGLPPGQLVRKSKNDLPPITRRVTS